MQSISRTIRNSQYQRKTPLIKGVLVTVAISYAVFAVIYLIEGLQLPAIIHSGYLVIAAISIYLLNQKKQRSALVLSFGFVCIEALVLSWVLGPEAGIPYIFFAIYPIIFILNSFYDRVLLVALILLNSACFILSFFSIPALSGLVDFPSAMAEGHRMSIIGLSSAITLAALYYLSKSNWSFEVAMLSTKEKLNAIYNSTSDANFLVDRDGMIISYNKPATDFLLRLTKVIIHPGLILSDFLPAEILEKYQLDLHRDIPESGERITDKVTMHDGTESYIEQSLYPVRDETGSIWAISINHRNVTTRYQLEMAKRSTDLLLDSINQNIKDGLYRVLEGKKLVYANKAFLEMFGFDSLEEVSLVSISNLYKHVSDRDKFVKALNEVGNVESSEIEFKRSNGTTFWGAISAIRTQNENGREIFDGSIRDISDIKVARDELIRAKEAAEAASRAKAEFLSTMSHEIRTPMNAVLGMTDLLLMEEPRADQADHLETLKFSANHLLAIINDILDLSKIDSGKVELEFTEVSVRQLLKSIITGLETKAREKGLELNFKLDSSIPDYITTDSTRLNQILTNLLGNAIKFTEEGQVAINVELENLANGRARIKFSVEDTGIGIAPENQEKVFEQFQQEHSYTTRKFGGTGLGLTIVKRLLGLFESEVKLESELGKGSTFWFVLEVDVPKRVIQDQKELEQPNNVANYKYKQLGNLRVLVVEDNIINIKIATKFLEKWGILVDVAEDGEIAVQKASDNKYDIILMDLQMPVMDGFQAATEIRKFDKDVPIIALTASAMLEVQNKVYSHGMNDFITKPIVPQDFNRKLSEYAHTHQN